MFQLKRLSPETLGKPDPNVKGASHREQLASCAVSDSLVVANHLRDCESQDFSSKDRIKAGLFSQSLPTRHLAGFAFGIHRRQPGIGLQRTNLLGALETFSQQMDQRCVNVVNRATQLLQLPGFDPSALVRTVVVNS